ncbi:hypothetical protein AMTR_s00019p00237670, partial [Amborella trichopoda]
SFIKKERMKKKKKKVEKRLLPLPVPLLLLLLLPPSPPLALPLPSCLFVKSPPLTLPSTSGEMTSETLNDGDKDAGRIRASLADPFPKAESFYPSLLLTGLPIPWSKIGVSTV